MADTENQQEIPEIDIAELNRLSGYVENEGGEAAVTDAVLSDNENLDSNIDLKELEDMASSAVDPITGAEIPIEASGITAALAINKSPLSWEDRLTMSTGNKEGNLKFLKSKYEDASIDKFGNFAVKQEGLWYKTDQSGLGIDDWTSTTQWIAAGKELGKDLADIAPELGAVATGFAVGAATGGLGLIPLVGAELAAGATIASTRTSLGRLVGTYEATPEEQFKDIAFEGLLSAAGVGIMAGVKPAGKFMMDHLPQIHKGLKALVKEGPESTGAALGNFFAKNSVGETAFEKMVKEPKALRNTFKDLTKRAAKIRGNKRISFHQAAQEAQLDDLYNFAKEADKLDGILYRSMQSDVIASAGEDFVNPSARSAFSAAIDSVQSGFTKVQIRVAEESSEFASSRAGKAFAKATDQAAKKTAKWKTLNPEKSLEYLLNQAKNSKALNPQQAKFISPSYNELSRMASAGTHIDSGLGELITRSEGPEILEQLNKSLMTMAQSKNIRGGKAVELAMENNKVFKRNIATVRKQLSQLGAGGASSKIGQISKRFVDATTNSIDEVSDGAYSRLNSEYSKLKTVLGPMSELIKESPEKSLKAAQSKLGAITSTRTSGALTRQSMREAIEAAEKLSPAAAKKLKSFNDSIELKEAALAWNPVESKGGTEFGIGTFAVLKQDPALLGAVGAKLAATSRALLKGGTKTTQLAWQQLNFLRVLDPAAREAFLNTPKGAGLVSLGATSYFKNNGQAIDMFERTEDNR